MISDYLAESLLNQALRNVTFSSPGTVYLGLFTSAITAEDVPGGGETQEVSGGSYIRQAIPYASSGFGDGIAWNTGAIIFPTPTADWGTVTYIAICDAVSGGNFLFYAPIAPRIVRSGGPAPYFPLSSIKLYLNWLGR